MRFKIENMPWGVFWVMRGCGTYVQGFKVKVQKYEVGHQPLWCVAVILGHRQDKRERSRSGARGCIRSLRI